MSDRHCPLDTTQGSSRTSPHATSIGKSLRKAEAEVPHEASTEDPCGPPTRRSRASNVIVRYRSPKGVAVGAPTGITMQGFAMSDVVVVIGSGSIGQANARRASAGKHVVLADLRSENAGRAAEIMLDPGFDVSPAVVDVQ